MPKTKKIRLLLGGYNKKRNKIKIKNMSNKNLEEGFPTLRDVAIILHECIGEGCTWNLAREISTRTGCNFITINKILHDIIHEYAGGTIENGYAKFKELGGYIHLQEK